jgi:hypothetical protein
MIVTVQSSRIGSDSSLRVISDFQPGSKLSLTLQAQILRVPYETPEIMLSYSYLDNDVPKENMGSFIFPIFYHSFFTFVRMSTNEYFRYQWDLKKHSHMRLVSKIFIGKFDFVKDEFHLQQVFPGVQCLDRADGLSKVHKAGQQVSVPLYQYGMAMRGSPEEVFWVRLSIDTTNTMFLECLVENSNLRSKAEFLLNHIIFVISE